DHFGAGRGSSLCDRFDLPNLSLSSIRRRAPGVKEKLRSRLCGSGNLFPVAQRGAAIAHARADETVVGILFERVRNPSRGAADGENRGWHRALKAEHADTYGEVEVEIGAQTFAFRNGGFDFERGLEQASA